MGGNLSESLDIRKLVLFDVLHSTRRDASPCCHFCQREKRTDLASLNFASMSFHSPYEQCLHQKSRSDASRPAHFPLAASKEEQPVIPDESVFQALSDNTQGVSTIPTVAQCAVHLELLEAFLVLKRRVLKSNSLDRTFGIDTTGKRDAAFTQRRLVKWDRFVALAVARFEVWWEKLVVKKHDLSGDEQHIITADKLPPLGILPSRCRP
jgi:hypothetical protein